MNEQSDLPTTCYPIMRADGTLLSIALTYKSAIIEATKQMVALRMPDTHSYSNMALDLAVFVGAETPLVTK